MQVLAVILAFIHPIVSYGMETS